MAQPDQAGRTGVHYAALEGQVAELTARLEAGEDPSLADHQGWVPLHFAAQAQNADAAAVLLRSGAPVDEVDIFGKTPLWVALFNVRDGAGDVIRVLLEAGADPDIKNNSGISPRDLTEIVANYDLKKHLPPAH